MDQAIGKTSKRDDDDALIPPEDSSDYDDGAIPSVTIPNGGTSTNTIPVAGIRAYITVCILFAVNLLNYIDRYTVAANLLDIQKYYGIEDSNSAAGILQTVFIISYMVMCPIFGFLGDRYSRKLVMSGGVFFWAAMTLACSFVPPDKYWAFVLLRGLVGVGEASYSTIASTLIADLFTGNKRTQMLMIFYFAIPVGSGLGYIVGSAIAEAFDGVWQWAFRFTPPLGVLSVFLIMVCIREPIRGQVETGNHAIPNTSYKTDLKTLSKNKSFLFFSLGFTSVSWVTGALGLWIPTYVKEILIVLEEDISNKSFIFTSLGFTGVSWVVGALALWMPTYVKDIYLVKGQGGESVDFIFGAITCATGFVGVGLGTTVAQLVRGYNSRADPIICGCGMILAVPFMYFGFLFAFDNQMLAWAFVTIAEIGLFLNWGLVPDMLLYVVIPPRRSTANACQMVMGHLLGDALSPWIVGFLSDQIRPFWSHTSNAYAQMMSLQYALYSATFITALGGGAFLAAALYIQSDRARVDRIVENARENRNEEDAILATPPLTPAGRVSPIVDLVY